MALNVNIVGGSGYTGGELVRLLLDHQEVSLQQVTSEKNAGKFVHKVHPNLRKRTDLKFSSIKELKEADVTFLCLPHGQSMNRIEEFAATSKKIIDLSGDFRLRNAQDYETWYGVKHPNPAFLEKFVYGIPELHRDEMKKANFVSSAGCNATCTILGLYPLFKAGLVDTSLPVVAESKCGSSEGGNKFSLASHHPERSHAVRSYAPTMHRHMAEMIQELGLAADTNFNFSATSIEMVRGILTTSHVFLKEALDEKEVWKAYRAAFGEEPFIRIVKERDGIYRYPEPKILSGTNYCDIGFKRDERGKRLVVMSAIDNLMKGASGQAVQAMNIMHGFREGDGLEFTGLHPI